MSAEANKAIVLRYFLESRNHPYNLDVMDETCVPDFAAEHKRWQRMEREAFPDKHFTLEDVIAEGDKVVWWCCAGPSAAHTWASSGPPLALPRRRVSRSA